MGLTNQKYYPWLLVLCYSLLGIFCPAAVTQFSMVVSDLAEVLAVDKQTVLLADTCRAVCLVVSMFLSSYIYRRLGLRGTIALGLAFQALPQFLIPLAVDCRSLPVFFVSKAAQGLNAMAFPLYISTITMWMDKRCTALATAIFNGSFTAGSGVGAWIAGKLVPAMGWKASFYAIGIMVAVLAVPVLLFTRDKACAEGQGAGVKTALPSERDGRKMQAVRGITPEESKNASKTVKKGVYAGILRQPVTWLCVLSLFANTWVAQAVTVDMSVYAQDAGYSKETAGNLMLIISIVTVVSSILAGGVSDWFANRSGRPLRALSRIMAMGYALSAVSAFLLPLWGSGSYAALVLAACAMMFGASWSAGVFWALPSEVYAENDVVAGTAFCSGASSVPNPISPMVVGVMLGTHGHWTAGWFTCVLASAVSLLASCLLAGQGTKAKKEA